MDARPGPAAAPRLVAPDVRYQASFLQSLREDHEDGPTTRGLDPERLADPAEFARYVAALEADVRAPGEAWAYVVRLSGAEPYAPPADGWVPQTVLWWAAGDEYLGRLNIRHRLSRDLLRRGGHIGYDVRPGARRRGHATAMLAAALPLAATLGIDPARMDCDADNVASRRVIERNRGRFEREEDGSLYFLVPTGRAPGAT